MTLVEHLRELRTRLIRSALAILVGSVIGWLLYDRIFQFLSKPYITAANQLKHQHDVNASLILDSIADAFNLQVKTSIAVGVVLASPVWLYQLFRFVSPGMLRREKRWAIAFVAAALPLFLVGVAAAYFALPHILKTLLGFTPGKVVILTHVDDYFGFLIQLAFFFGLGFVIPVLVVVLNMMGVLPAKRLASWWRWILFLSLVFAAIANPTGDVITMLLFAVPQLVLFLIAYVICWFNDRRRAKRDVDSGFGGLADDEASPLDLSGHTYADGLHPSDLHEAND
jgi:sec-independent protein translocase protein TatC